MSVTLTNGYAPVILRGGNGAGRRISFTAQSSGLYLIEVTNVGSAGNYTFRAVDTTLVNATWSTCGGFDNEWIFENVSDMTVTGALTIYGFNNVALMSVQFLIPPGGGTIRYSHYFD